MRTAALQLLRFLPALLLFQGLNWAATRSVGPGEDYATPCQAIAAADPGDTIEISSAGVYAADVCAWSTSHLTIRGVGGRPTIDAAGSSLDGLGTWVISGDNTTIENVELSGASGADGRGAAIRFTGRNLVLRNVYVHRNQAGVITADSGPDENVILIEFSEFGFNGTAADRSANVSIGRSSLLVLRHNYLHDAVGAPLLESAATENQIMYNRLTGESGTSEEEVLLEGAAYLAGNIIQKGANSRGAALISIVGEVNQRSMLVHNTVVSDAGQRVVFVRLGPDREAATIQNNIFAGDGEVTDQESAVLVSNISGEDPLFVSAAEHDYRLRSLSPAIDAGSEPGLDDFFALPEVEYRHNACYGARVITNAPDIGAIEWTAGDSADGPHCGSFLARAPAIKDSGRSRRLEVTGLAVSSITLNPASVSGATFTTQNVVGLNAAAPAGGVWVSLSSSNTAVALVPPSVLVAAGRTSTTFYVQAKATTTPAQAVITASYGGASVSATLNCGSVALTAVMLSPAALGGGATSTLNTVTLSGPAASGGAVVSVESSNPAVASVPSSVLIPVGASKTTLPIHTTVVQSTTNVTITAQYKGVSKSAVLRVDPVGILSLKLIPASLAGGQDTAVRVDLNGVAGSGGVAVALTSSNPAIAPLVQSTLSIPAGATWAGTLAHTAMVTAPVSVTITARFNGVTKTATLTVRPPSLSILSVSPSSLTGGAASTTNTIWLDGPAPPGGFTVSLVSSNPAVASVPPTMVVPSGAKYVKFAIKTTPVATSTAVTISASAKGVTKTGNLTVRP